MENNLILEGLLSMVTEQIAKLTNSTLVVDLIPNEPTEPEPETEQVTLELEMEEEKSNRTICNTISGKCIRRVCKKL